MTEKASFRLLQVWAYFFCTRLPQRICGHEQLMVTMLLCIMSPELVQLRLLASKWTTCDDARCRVDISEKRASHRIVSMSEMSYKPWVKFQRRVTIMYSTGTNVTKWLTLAYGQMLELSAWLLQGISLNQADDTHDTNTSVNNVEHSFQEQESVTMNFYFFTYRMVTDHYYKGRHWFTGDQGRFLPHAGRPTCRSVEHKKSQKIMYARKIADKIRCVLMSCITKEHTHAFVSILFRTPTRGVNSWAQESCHKTCLRPKLWECAVWLVCRWKQLLCAQIKKGPYTYPFGWAHRAIGLLEVHALLGALALELFATEELVVLAVAVLGLERKRCHQCETKECWM